MRKHLLFPLAALAFVLAACTTTPPAAPSAATMAARAEQNKRNALAFYEAVFNQHDLAAADRYIGDTYLQHNPRVADGRQAFVDAFRQIFARFPQRHSTVHQAIADGDLVALHVHTVTSPEDRGVAIVDIFRFDEQGKIVEHWDVIQPVPESSVSGRGMFPK